MQFVKPWEMETPEARKAFCESLQAKIRADKRHFQKDFKQMLEDLDICREGAPPAWVKAGNYRVNVSQRFVKQKVAALYAKNPRAVAKRCEKLWFRMWDGSQQQLMQAAQGAMTGDLASIQLIQDVMEGQAQMQLLDRVGKTLEIVYGYYTKEQTPPFKSQMKTCVRSACSTAVGYVELGFQREMEHKPETATKIADHVDRIKHIERLMKELQDSDSGVDPQMSKEAEELKQSLASLQAEPMVMVREGLTFDFPFCTSIIPHSACTSIKGWIGAEWLTKEMFLTHDDVKKFFNIDLGKGQYEGYQSYKTTGASYKMNPRADIEGKRDDMACCWIMQHKPSGMVYTMIDGLPDFVEEPRPPCVRLERFFTIYALTFNESIHHKFLFPNSDVRTMLPQQMELNRSKEGVRRHRKANRPGYIAAGGMLSKDDMDRIGAHDDNEVIATNSLPPGMRLSDVIQEIPKQGIDPNLYETNGVLNDMFLAIGMDEPGLGTSSGNTATEAAIAQSSRTAASEEDIDELNDFLTELARDAGQVLLTELDEATVKEIAGPGAVWPTLTADQVAKELYLEIVAGSNGRPNRAAEETKIQKLMPLLLQVPGVTPEFVAKKLIQALDDGIDLAEAFAAGLPSIQMMNSAQQTTGASPEDDPNAQGEEGGNNAPQPPGRAGGGVPMGGNNVVGGMGMTAVPA